MHCTAAIVAATSRLGVAAGLVDAGLVTAALAITELIATGLVDTARLGAFVVFRWLCSSLFSTSIN